MKSAVLVIDVQAGLFAWDDGPFEADAVVERINAVTARARNQNVPMIMIQHESESGFLAFEGEGWELQPNLVSLPSDIIIRKTTPDSFLETNLQAELEKLGITNLVICGYATEFCVDTTTRRAAGLGYDIQLVADAHTTHDKDHASGQQIRDHHNATLQNVSSFSGEITCINAEDILFDG